VVIGAEPAGPGTRGPNHGGCDVSLAIARAVRLPEPEWAAISTMVVTQSTLGAAMTISGQRFAGTALGAPLQHY